VADHRHHGRFCRGLGDLRLILARYLSNGIATRPSRKRNGWGLGGQLGQLGSLASLAGINIDGGGNQVSMKTRALAIIQSCFFIQDFFEKHDLLVPFMGTIPGEASGTIEIDPELYDESAGQWVREPSPAGNVIPSGQEVYEAFSEFFEVAEDDLTGLVTISLEWYEPRLIKQWMDMLVEDLNNYMREQDTLEAERAIEYLTRACRKPRW